MHTEQSDMDEKLTDAASLVELDSARARGTYRFSVVAHHIYLFSAIGHFLFIILFAALRVPPLALYNVGSTLLFLFCIRLNRRGWHCAAFSLAGIEVFVHSTLCAFLIGWTTGYHYFIIGIVPFAMLLPRSRRLVKIALSLVIFSGYGVVYFLTAQRTPSFPLDHAIHTILNFTNLGVAFGAFSLLVHYLYTASVRAEAIVQTLSRTDQLTGLLNRRGMQDHLASARSALDREGEPFSVILGDLDHFKRVNDEHGHVCGDRVLVETGKALAASLRSRDIVCRWGGEEFLVLLPGTEGIGVERVGRKLLDTVRQLRVACGSADISVTITLGAATARRDMEDDRLITAADHALYSGKKAGRNRFVMA
ncbi:MAG: GGDEF domain-containing protein [Spirochaetaceae bacterium]|nr:MAG: GGDEF domain-containing protein [Spirochaetaceae bacterium]